ncbi:MAG TPA: hypothetical protein VMV35_00675 [Halothiobacillus sp.]|nr:hypothetical protein [Halothiobacillus sp.]
MRLTIKLRPAFLRWLAWLILGLALVGLSACATGPRLTDHAFSFDARWDSKDVEVLDYRYGDYVMTRAPAYQLRQGQVGQMTNINGPFPRGDTLYVKWRIKSTEEIFEDTVDLKSRLPDDITRHRIYFIIKGPQLNVYLISPEKLNPNPCPPREELRRLGVSDAPDDRIFSRYCYRKIITIYPDQPKPQESK